MNIKNKITNSNTLSIIKYGEGFKYIALATLLCLIATFLDIKTISLVPDLIKSISNEQINNGAYQFILFALFSGFFRILLAFLSSRINTIIASNISKKIINAIQSIDIYELENFGVSKLSQVFSNDIQTITNELINPILQILTSFILLISIIIFLLIKIPIITINISIIYLILYYFFIKTSKRKIRKNSTKTSYLRDKFVQSASEIIISARYLKNSLRGRKVLKFLKTNDLSIKKMSAENNFLSVYPKYIAESFGFLAIAIIGLISSSSGNTQVVSILGILALSIQKIIPSFQSIFGSISSINVNSANIKRMNDLIKLSYKKNNFSKKIELIERIGNIKKVINLKAKEKRSQVLIKAYVQENNSNEYFDFKLLNNQWTAIIGASGCGKTTFMDLITGVAFPLNKTNSWITKKGEFKLEITKNINFIYLSQFNYIPRCSIIEYITNSDDPKFIIENKKYIVDLFKSVGLYEELEFKSSDDIFKNLSENALSISGGQAQRLNILRTIFEIKNNKISGYKILAMDEPFKGLDEASKSKCINLLKKVSKTALLITHSNQEAHNLCENIYQIT